MGQIDFHSDYFCTEDYTPTEAEINIFRLWQCPRCNRWISLVGAEKDDASYKQIEEVGFEKAKGHVVWR